MYYCTTCRGSNSLAPISIHEFVYTRSVSSIRSSTLRTNFGSVMLQYGQRFWGRKTTVSMYKPISLPSLLTQSVQSRCRIYLTAIHKILTALIWRAAGITLLAIDGEKHNKYNCFHLRHIYQVLNHSAWICLTINSLGSGVVWMLQWYQVFYWNFACAVLVFVVFLFSLYLKCSLHMN